MKLTRVFYDIDLRAAKPGLAEIARKAKTPLDDSTIIFLNRKLTAFKLLTSNKYCTSYNEGRRIPLEAIEHLPQAFGGDRMTMTAAIREAVSIKLKKKRQLADK